MKATYVSHATMVIEAAGLRIATDPWWEGPAYAGQWHVFPRPLNAGLVDDCSIVLLSHGHQDHLHEPTLATLRKDKRLYYPFYWYEGTTEWLESMGFASVHEPASWRTEQLGAGCAVTFAVNGQDALMVIEAEGAVLLNVNDALHSSDPATIDLFARTIRARWPKVDMMFCGFGGASYYPNVFHAPGKDDAGIGALREDFFAANFCRIAAAIQPAYAVPFAADFVLLDDSQRWINGARFPRGHLPDYFDAHFRPPGCTTQIIAMYSGDVLTPEGLQPLSPYRATLADGEVHVAIETQYPELCSAFQVHGRLSDAEADTLAADVERHIAAEAAFHDPARTASLVFSIEVLDSPDPRWLVVRRADGATRVTRADEAASDGIARIAVASGPLRHSMGEDWGGDDLLIGYGCHVTAAAPADLRQARLCAELLLRHPHPSDYFRRKPLRALRYMWQNKGASLDKIRRKLAGIPGANTTGGDLWVTRPAEDIRRQLAIPARPR